MGSIFKTTLAVIGGVSVASFVINALSGPSEEDAERAARVLREMLGTQPWLYGVDVHKDLGGWFVRVRIERCPPPVKLPCTVNSVRVLACVPVRRGGHDDHSG
jgi:hypothetical protein